MQKALTQMNIQLANVLSDVGGMTGQAIVKAILAGERDPYQLAALRNWRVKASEEEIARSLEGNWQEEHLFVLQQEQEGYQFCLKQMAECDQRLQQYLQQQEDRSQGASLPEEKRKERLRKKKKGNTPQFDLRAELFRMTGTDLTQIDGIDVTTTMTILSEAGWDTLRLSHSYLGAQFRRLRSKLGAPVAIKAMAAKLARLVYRMLRYGMPFMDRGVPSQMVGTTALAQ
jgi:transposase